MSGNVNRMELHMDHIQIKAGTLPQGSCIIEDLDANRWVILESYVHLGDKFVRAVRIPNIPPTYKIVEREE